MGIKGITNRQRIIKAADQLFYSRGYNQTSFSDISDQTGIPRGNFYYYFKTKEDILDAVMDTRLTGYRQMLEQCEREAKDPRQRLLEFIRVPLRNADMVIQYGCPVGTLSAELIKDGAQQQAVPRSHVTAVFDLLRHWCRQQLHALGVNATRADELALDLLARLQGMVLISNIYSDRDYLQRAIADIEIWLAALLNHEVKS
jgi:AcrR family transcriptional regulator